MCTGVRFTDTAGHLFWGRNLDWNEDYGEFPIIMPKGYQLHQQFLGTQTTKYACIGMGIEYDGYPLYFNCGNEAGLAVGGLNFPGYAQFEEGPIDGKTNVAAFEVPAWIAANFSTVDEAEAALKNTAIVAKAPSPEMGIGMLHWMIADAKRSIVIEYKADGMHIYDDTVDVLTNQPPFDWHMENLRNYMCCSGSWPGDIQWRGDTLKPFGTGATMRGIPGDPYSTSRFVKAAFVNTFHPQKATEAENVARMFHTLGSVSFTEGMAAMADGTFEKTLFSDCFSAATGTYYYNTYDSPAIKCARLSDYADAPTDALVKPEMKIFA
ncbi:MAG: choloylglycine hydrolase family protein [Eggerthellaceae bacterium]|nr:choloylglycine hydrolase family protein [Eggerthellaceae bacterium]